MICFRIVAMLAAFSGCLGVCFAEEPENRKRFKHEKHGAIVFAKGEGYEIKCDIYQPFADEPRPVMLAIHGGAWTTGTKFAMFRHARILANRGYVVMAINYRLAPEHKWPAQIHDCKHAVRWIREHAEKYNADPDRVYAFGYSAGAHLAAILATSDVDDGLEGDVAEPYSRHSTRIQGLIAGGTPSEFSWIGENDTTLKYWLGETRAANPEVYANASPTSYVSKDDPPLVLFHGIQDGLVPVSSPKCFVECCQSANANVELLLRNGGHAAAFTWTTNLIESLAKLEEMISEKDCRRKITELVKLVKAFVKSEVHLPLSLDDLGKFAVDSGDVNGKEFADLILNERDGKHFEIRWSSKDGVIVSEAIGADGVKLSSTDKTDG